MDTAEVMSNVNVNKEEVKLKFREKFALAIGTGTSTFHFQMMQMFLLFFYTDVMKISPVYVAGLFLVVRILDAIATPIFGIFVDKVTTPWGKYKPWLFMLGVPFAVFGWLTFTNFNLGPTGNLIYATITYIIYSVLSAIVHGPGGALLPAVTKRIDERIAVGQIGYFTAIIGGMLVAAAITPLYKALGGGNDGKGFSIVMGIVAAICILINIFQVRTIKERYVNEPQKEDKKHSLKEMLKAVFTNKTAIIVYLNTIAINLSAGIRSAIMIYFFKYFFHNESLMITMGIVGLFPTLLGVSFSGAFTKRVGIKKNIMISVFVNIITGAAIILVPATGIGQVIFIVLNVIGGFFGGLSNPAFGSLMPAAMDYTEWKDKMNVNAFMGSFSGFVQTLSTALSGAIAAAALSLIGYVPGAEQSSGTLFGFKVLMSILPAAIYVLQISILWFDLTEEKQKQITTELAERRKLAESNAAI